MHYSLNFTIQKPRQYMSGLTYISVHYSTNDTNVY